MPFLSIVIPVFNSQNYIAECLDSIIDQKFQDFEIIVVDDSSSDDSYDICLLYAKKNKRVNVFKNPKKGVSASRNFGIKQSHGDYLMFVDSDDKLSKNALEIIAKEIKTEDFLIGSYSTFYEGNRETVYHESKNSTYQINSFVEEIDFFVQNALLQGPCWKVFKADIINKNSLVFPEDLSYGEDAFFVYSFLEHSETLKSINESLYIYTLHPNSLSHGFNEEKISINLSLNKKIYDLKDKFKKGDIQTFYLTNISSFFMYLNDIGIFKARNPLRMIKNALNNPLLKESFSLYNGAVSSKKRRIGIFCAKHKLVPVLYWLSRINAKKERSRWLNG